MRIISMMVYGCAGEEPALLAEAYELSFASVFQRGTIKEFIKFNSRLVVSRTPIEERLEVVLEKGICYSYLTSEKIGATIICDEEYPPRVAIDLIFKILDNLNEHVYTNKINLQSIIKDTDIKFRYLDTLIKDWQDPTTKDNILKIQTELNEATNIMKKNLQDLLKREEALENLMSKSKDLSSVSVEFYKKAKSANNKCCNLY